MYVIYGREGDKRKPNLPREMFALRIDGVIYDE